MRWWGRWESNPQWAFAAPAFEAGDFTSLSTPPRLPRLPFRHTPRRAGAALPLDRLRQEDEVNLVRDPPAATALYASTTSKSLQQEVVEVRVAGLVRVVLKDHPGRGLPKQHLLGGLAVPPVRAIRVNGARIKVDVGGLEPPSPEGNRFTVCRASQLLNTSRNKVGEEGIEPPQPEDGRFTVCCGSPTPPLPQRCPRWRSNPRLRVFKPVLIHLSYRGIGAKGRSRTSHTGIFSPVLYQLSYLGIRGEGGWSRLLSIFEPAQSTH